MKIRLNRSLRAALMACYAVATPIATTVTTGALVTGAIVLNLAPQAQAEDVTVTDINGNNVTINETVNSYEDTNTMFSGTDQGNILMDLTVGNSYGYLFFDTPSNICMSDIIVRSWSLSQGNGYCAYFFTGSITSEQSDDGTYASISSGYSGDLAYYFAGDMSGFAGDITLGADTRLQFGDYDTTTYRSSVSTSGSAAAYTATVASSNNAVSGTGTITHDGGTTSNNNIAYLIYNYGSTVTATIANAAIYITASDGHMVLEGGATYTLNTVLDVNGTLDITEGSSVTFTGGKTSTVNNLSIGSDILSNGTKSSLTIDAETSLVVESSLTLSYGSSITNNGTLTLSSDSTVTGSTDASLTSAGTLVLEDGVTITVDDSLSLDISGGTVALSEVSSAQIIINDLDSFTIDSYTIFDLSDLDITAEMMANGYTIQLFDTTNETNLSGIWGGTDEGDTYSIDYSNFTGIDNAGLSIEFNDDGSMYLHYGDMLTYSAGESLLWTTTEGAGNTNFMTTGDDSTSTSWVAGSQLTISGKDVTITLGSDVDPAQLLIDSVTVTMVDSGNYRLNCNQISFSGEATLVLEADVIGTSARIGTGDNTTATVEFNSANTIFNYSNQMNAFAGNVIVTDGTVNIGASTDAHANSSLNYNTVTVNGGELNIGIDLSVTSTIQVSAGSATFNGEVTAGNVTVGAATITFNDDATLVDYSISSDSAKLVIGDEADVSFTIAKTGMNAFRTYTNTLNVVLGSDATLDMSGSGAYMWMNAGMSVTSSDGDSGGTMTIAAMLLGYNGTTVRTLTIGEGATLEVKNSSTGSGSQSASFGIGYGGTGNVEISGTLILNSGISMYDTSSSAKAILNVYEGGTLQMNVGLITGSSIDNTITLNIYDGADLVLGNQSITTDYANPDVYKITVNIYDGATISENNAASVDIANVYTSMDFGKYSSTTAADGTVTTTSLVSGDNASVDFSASAGKTLKLNIDVAAATAGVNLTANIVGAGTVEFAGSTNLATVTVAENATLAISGEYTFNGAIVNSGTVEILDGALLDITGLTAAYNEDTNTYSYTLVSGGTSSMYEGWDSDIMNLFTAESIELFENVTVFEFNDGVLSYTIGEAPEGVYWNSFTGQIVSSDIEEYPFASAEVEIITTNITNASLNASDGSTIDSLTISGANTLTINGNDTLTITDTMSVSNAVTVATTVNVATLTGSGSITTTENGTLTITSVDAFTGSLSVEDGSSVEIKGATDTITFADLDLIQGSLTVGDNITIVDSTTDNQKAYGVEVNIGENSSITSQDRFILVGGSNFTVSGLGTYSIAGLQLISADNSSSTLTINAGATLNITGVNTGDSDGAAFNLGYWASTSKIDVKGMLIVNDTMYVGNSTSTITVYDGGILQLNSGLGLTRTGTNTTHSTLTVNENGKLILGDSTQEYDSEYLDVSMQSGSTLAATTVDSGVVNVYEDITFGGTVTFDGSLSTLKMNTAVGADGSVTANIVGTVQFAGGSDHAGVTMAGGDGDGDGDGDSGSTLYLTGGENHDIDSIALATGADSSLTYQLSVDSTGENTFGAIDLEGLSIDIGTTTESGNTSTNTFTGNVGTATASIGSIEVRGGSATFESDVYASALGVNNEASITFNGGNMSLTYNFNFTGATASFNGGTHTAGSLTDVNGNADETLNLYSGAKLTVSSEDVWYIYGTSINFSADTAGNSAALTLSGALTVSGGGNTVKGDGTLSATSLTVTDGSFTMDADTALSLSGAIDVNGGTVTLNGDVTTSYIDVSAGSLTLGDSLSLTGSQQMYVLATNATKGEGGAESKNVAVYVTGGGSVTLADGMTISDTVYVDNGSITFNSLAETGSTYTLSGGLYLSRNESNSRTTDYITLDDNTKVNVTSGTNTYSDYTMNDLTVTLGANSELNNDVKFWFGEGTLTIQGADNVTNDSAGTFTVNQFLTNYTSAGDSVTVNIKDGAILEVTGTTTTSSTASGDSFVLSCYSGQSSSMTIDGKLIINSGITSATTSSAAASITVNSGGTAQFNDGIYTATGVADDAVTISLKDGSTLILGDQGTPTSSSGTVGAITVNVATGVTIASNDAAGTEVTKNVDTLFTYADNAVVTFSAGTGTDESTEESFDYVLKMNSAVTGTNVSAKIAGTGTVEFAGGATLSALDVASGASLTLSNAATVSGATTVVGALVITGDNGSLDGAISLAGGSLTVDSTLSNALSVTAEGSSLSASTLNSTITLGAGISLALSDNTVEFGENFSIDLGETEWTAGDSYTIFTNAGATDVSLLDYSDIVGCDAENFTYTWTNTDGTISLSVLAAALEGDLVWNDEGYWENSDGTPSSGFNADSNLSFETTGTTSETSGADPAITVTGEQVAGTLTVSGTGTATLAGEADAEGNASSLTTSGVTVDDGATLAVQTDLSTSEESKVEVNNGTVSVSGDGSINSDITLGVAAQGEGDDATAATTGTLVAGSITVSGEGAGVDLADTEGAEGSVVSDKLSNAAVTGATVTVDTTAQGSDGTATLDGGSIDSDSTLVVNEGSTLELTNGATVYADTTLAEGSSVKAGSITVTGGSLHMADAVLDDSNDTITNSGSLSADSLQNAVVSASTVTIGAVATDDSGSSSSSGDDGSGITPASIATPSSLSALSSDSSSITRTTANDGIATVADETVSGTTTIKDTTFADASTIELLDGANLTLENVILNSDTIYDDTEAATTCATVTIIDSTVEASTDSSSLTIATNTDTSKTTFSIDTFSSLTNTTVMASGDLSIVLNLTETQWTTFFEDFAADYTYEFILAGVSDVIKSSEGAADNLNVTISIATDGKDTYVFADSSAMIVGSNLVITTVPEPSTSALSLMALAGLLARRRRKA